MPGTAVLLLYLGRVRRAAFLAPSPLLLSSFLVLRAALPALDLLLFCFVVRSPRCPPHSIAIIENIIGNFSNNWKFFRARVRSSFSWCPLIANSEEKFNYCRRQLSMCSRIKLIFLTI